MKRMSVDSANSSYETDDGKYFVKVFTDTFSGLEGELAAYELAILVGLNVPESGSTLLDGKLALKQKFIRGRTRDPQKGRLDIEDKVFTFDFLIGNGDRHYLNYLIEDRTDTVWLIDHERAFDAGMQFNKTLLQRIGLNETRFGKSLRVDIGLLEQFKHAFNVIDKTKYPNIGWAAVKARIGALDRAVKMGLVFLGDIV